MGLVWSPDQSNPIPDQNNPITDCQILYYFHLPALEFFVYLDIIMIDSRYLKSATIQMAYAYSEICQTSKMERFVKVINNLNSWAIFAKRSTLEIDRVQNMPLNVVQFLLLTWNYYYCLYYSLLVYCYLETKFLRKQLSTI